MSVSTKPYIGTRDFYPEEIAFRNWMFRIQREVAELFGYLEYAAPLLEPLSLYKAKSSDEIVSEQLYRFTDRGDREVAIRPEMTPTLARMVVAKSNETPRPIRWFSIANFMRYERPGKGRLREFYQLNVDLFGSSSAGGDVEILLFALNLMKRYGATSDMYRVRYSDRRLLDSYLDHSCNVNFSDEKKRAFGRLLDKRDKIGESEFRELMLQESDGNVALVDRIDRFLTLTMDDLPKLADKHEIDADAAASLLYIKDVLEKAGCGEMLSFDPSIVRGFDYYTGLIFEIYDNDPENRRALFGGGRYDRLLSLFGKEDIPAVGFGMGDVTLESFLRNHHLVPDSLFVRQGVYITLFSEELKEQMFILSQELRDAGVSVEMSLEPSKKLGRQFEIAEKKGYRHILIIGTEELASGTVRVKSIVDGNQLDVKRSQLVSYLLEH